MTEVGTAMGREVVEDSLTMCVRIYYGVEAAVGVEIVSCFFGVEIVVFDKKSAGKSRIFQGVHSRSSGVSCSSWGG